MKRIWGFFSSTGLTVILATLICIDAAWGSVVCIRNPEVFQALDQAILMPWLFTAGIKDPGLSLWIFILVVLIFLFALNTAACTVDRLIGVVKRRSPLRSFFPHVVHVGFLVALLGHLLGSTYGFRSPGNILVKGEPVVVPHTKSLLIRLDDVAAGYSPAGELTSVRTFVTLLEGDKVLLSDMIQINDPLRYGGAVFYHADHGSFPTGLVVEVEGARRSVNFGGTFKGPDNTGFSLGSLYTDIAIQEIVTNSGESAFLSIARPGASVTLAGSTIRLVGYVTKPYAIITINRDPGIWFVIAGSSILVLGMVFLLFSKGERGELMNAAHGRPGAGDSA
jgi:cytochrome c biogenesis protein ResB